MTDLRIKTLTICILTVYTYFLGAASIGIINFLRFQNVICIHFFQKIHL